LFCQLFFYFFKKKKKGTGKKPRTAGIYYGVERHPVASLMVSRCMRKNYQLTIINEHKKGDRQENRPSEERAV